ncbi:MAG TPA: glycosyltransferase family 2 protein [Saprospiraceae bacterium]|nr:glycosyltransferase family 2 protein [Saprospiraceae bacterium]
MQISVVIITFNEQEEIGRCIDSLIGIADEILVVDSFSTDETESISKSKGARFIQHKFEGYIKQKNWAMDQASYDWILSLDADECISPNLFQSILQIKQLPKYDSYSMNRLNFYCNKAIKTCGWYPDKKIRLWNRNVGKWGGTDPHDKIVLQNTTITGHLNGDLWHYTYSTNEDMLKQVENFANIASKQLKKKSLWQLILKMIFSPAFNFIKHYLFHLGFIDGSNGLLICYHQCREVYLKYYRAIKLKLQSIY